MIDTATPEGQLKRMLEFSKRKHDHWWRVADALTGRGDYTAADEGEPPQNAEWN